MMTPRYSVRIWPEGDWWMARVTSASDDADPAPVDAVTQARSMVKIEPMVRELIAVILDAGEGDFDLDLDYRIADDLRELISQAKGARAWLDAAGDLWQERSVAAARALAGAGFSLRETALLLGLSHQRVGQLLGKVSG
jgi:hypothetical protein